MPQFDLLATAAFGLEAVVSRELTGLGYQGRVVRPGRVLFSADAAGICRANLWLRSAERVLLQLGVFPAADFGELFDQTHALPWEQWIPADGAFPVKGRSHKSQLSSEPACQKIVKKAIVDKLKAAHGVENLPEDGATYTVEVSLLDNQAALTLDTSGAGLHKRGYRSYIGPAPLKETLAAALVLLSFWRAERPLWDPFCGGGTIPIEAAMLGRNIAPGLQRSFVAENWPTLAAALWQEARQEAKDVIRPDLATRLIGSDIDGHILHTARRDAATAGVDGSIHFQEQDFTRISSQREYGCLITNPPYGGRLGEMEEVERIYQALPEVLRRFPTWSHYILTARSDFERLVGQAAHRRRKLFNARISCTLFQFYGPRPGSKHESAEAQEAPSVDVQNRDASANVAEDIAAEAAAEEATVKPRERTVPAKVAPREIRGPAFGGVTAKGRQQADLFAARIRKRARHLRRWPTKLDITCYRLYDRDIPEIPLVVERYDDYLHVSEYERPHERSPAQHAEWLELMVATLGDVFEMPTKHIFLKRRLRQRGSTQHEKMSEAGYSLVVREGGLRFQVNLSDYIDTGLFLDHRQTRAMVREEAAGRRMLNLFCYTGAFTVYAAAGGAAATTSVDSSNRYLQWAQENMALNELTDPKHAFIRGDVVQFLQNHRPEAAYDLAFIDPPTFSNRKDQDHVWDVQRDHANLLNQVAKLLTPGGVVFFSSNFRRFKLDAGLSANFQIHEISKQTVPPDFRNRRIHRCWRMTRHT